jgi:flagellar biosynthesis/type III secretory pathway protein FliH
MSTWIPARPAVHRTSHVGTATAWSLDELALDAPVVADLATPAPAGPSAAELAAAEQARAEAERAAERERIMHAAYADGYADGEAAGRAAEQARLASLTAAAETALQQLRDGEARWTGSIEENVCALAVAVARHVIGREIVGDAAAITDLVRRALTEFPIDQQVAIRLNPADLMTLATVLPTEGIAPTLGGTAGVAPNREARWIADPNVVAGGCVVEGRERIVDGRVDTALERLYRRLSGTHA